MEEILIGTTMYGFGGSFFCPYAILMFCFVPFIVMADSVFRESDILFVSPEEKIKICQIKNENREESLELNELENQQDKGKSSSSLYSCPSTKEAWVFAKFRDIIHRPIFRMIVYHFWELFFLIMLGLHVIDPSDTNGKPTFYDI